MWNMRVASTLNKFPPQIKIWHGTANKDAKLN